jgi:hypothetical protein
MRPFEIAREGVAGVLGALGVLILHFGMTLPHWGLFWLDLVLAGFLGCLLYAGIRLSWATQPGWVERLLGVEIDLRLQGASDDPDDLRSALRHTLEAVGGQVTAPMQEQLKRIDWAINAVLDGNLSSNVGRQAQYTIAATVQRYLPDTLERYLQLPENVAQAPIDDNGRTAHDMVMEQLGVLATETEAIVEDMHAGKLRELSAHGRFLEDRFNTAGNLL